MEQPRRLAQTGHFLSFLYPSGPWIDTKDFRPVPDGPITAIEALQALLADPEYRDHYCSPENISCGGPLRGPYWADRIKASDFGEVSVADCESILSGWRTDWVSEDDPPEEKIEADAVIGTALWADPSGSPPPVSQRYARRSRTRVGLGHWSRWFPRVRTR